MIVEFCLSVFFFQAEDGIRDLVRSRGLGDVYKRQDDGMGGEHQFGRRAREAREGETGHEGVAGDAEQDLSLIHI